METNDLHALIAHAAAMLSAQAADRSVQITLQLSAPDAQLACDAEQMTQVLLNLMLNGLQILKQGGRMQISTAVQAEMLVIDVADDGPGIAPEERQRIFEAFFFKREGGLGLGLAVVQKIVAAHGGDIEASESELGGALFRIRLPKRTEDA
jgi:signal transduction histidine kinase